MRPVNTSSPMVHDPGHAMHEERKGAQQACVLLQHQLRAVGTLFGEPLGRTLRDQLEVAQERYEDAFRSAEEVIASYRGEAARTHERMQALTRRVSELHTVLVDAAVEVQRRYAVGRNEVPDEYRPLIEAGGDLWSWVYPPEDSRHTHDTDAGGTCRHPCCVYHSDYSEEPF